MWEKEWEGQGDGVPDRRRSTSTPPRTAHRRPSPGTVNGKEVEPSDRGTRGVSSEEEQAQLLLRSRAVSERGGVRRFVGQGRWYTGTWDRSRGESWCHRNKCATRNVRP